MQVSLLTSLNNNAAMQDARVIQDTLPGLTTRRRLESVELVPRPAYSDDEVVQVHGHNSTAKAKQKSWKTLLAIPSSS